MPAEKPRRVNLTKANIEALKLPDSERQYIYDIKTPGLAICLTAAGRRTFYLYRKLNGKPERIRIGEWPRLTVEQARSEADRLNGRIADGQNPNDKRRVNRKAPTLGQVFDEFIEAPTRGRSKRPRSPKTIKDYRWQFKAHLEPWRERQLSKIKRADIERLHNEIGAENGPYLANRVLALLKAVLNFAVEQEYYPLNPATRLRAFEEQSRERFLQADEMQRFFAALEMEPAADFFKLSLLTGARQSNVLSMRWDEVDLAAATWRIPHTKNGQPLTVPLAPAAVAVLKERRQQVKGEWVFPGREGEGGKRAPRYAWERVCKRAGIEGLRMHDLRRSLGSWQASTGASLTVIGKSLGHQSIQATKIYARVDLETVRKSVDTAAAAILAAAKRPEEGKSDKPK
jgi:integrase